MNSLVIDGSTILGVLIRDKHSSYTSRALNAIQGNVALYVPSHWWLDTTNGLIMAERRKRLPQADVSEALHFLRSLRVITDEQTASRCGGETIALARQYALTIYDAAYLELAIRRRSRLATIDKALGRAAAAAGVELLV